MTIRIHSGQKSTSMCAVVTEPDNPLSYEAIYTFNGEDNEIGEGDEIREIREVRGEIGEDKILCGRISAKKGTGLILCLATFEKGPFAKA